MRNAALIIGGIALIAVIVAIIIFATAPKPKLPTDSSNPLPTPNPSGGGTTPNPGPTGNPNDSIDGLRKAEIDTMVTMFRNEFETEVTTARCGIITQTNQLSSSQLAYFNSKYITQFQTTPKAQMDAASVWCWYSDVDENALYAKLEALNASANTMNVGEFVYGMYKTKIAEIADEFYKKFNTTGGYRCDVINQAQALLPEQLDYFKTYHYAKYALTPKQMMDGVYGWCPSSSTNAYALYARL